MKLKSLVTGYLRPIAAVLILALAVPVALALDVDQTRNIPARQQQTQQVNYYRITVNFNDPRISTAQKFGRLLQNSFISQVSCHVITAFNASLLNVFTVGTSVASANEIINASGSNQSIDETSATYQNVSASAGAGIGATSAADVDLYVRYTQGGTAATTGKVTCILAFVPNNDM